MENYIMKENVFCHLSQKHSQTDVLYKICLNSISVGFFSHIDKRNLHSTLRVVAPVFDGLLLFVALHSNVLLLCSRFPVMMIEDTWVPAISEMTVNPRYQVMVGAGTALLLTTQWIIYCPLSANVSGLSLGIKDTLCTSTVSFDKRC